MRIARHIGPPARRRQAILASRGRRVKSGFGAAFVLLPRPPRGTILGRTMMRSAALALASACVLAACNQSAPSASNTGGMFPDLTHAAYRAEATITGRDGASVPVVMVRDGQKQRGEIDGARGRRRIMLNGEGDSYMVSSAGGHTMAMRMTGMADQVAQFRDPTKDWSRELATNAHRGGPCSGAGQTGTEWTRESDGVTNAACVTDDGIVLSAREGERTL